MTPFGCLEISRALLISPCILCPPSRDHVIVGTGVLCYSRGSGKRLSGITKQVLKLGGSATIQSKIMNKRLMIGAILFLSIVSVYAADRVPENGFGIVPMPYEAKANAGNPFVITKETVIVARAAETKQCAAYLQQRLRQSCGLTLSRRGSTSGKAIVLSVSDDAVAFSENDAYRLESNADKIIHIAIVA